MINRRWIAAVMVLLYVIAVNIWIYLLADNQLTIKQNRLSGYAINGIMLIFCFWDLKNITRLPFHDEFNDVAFATLISNFILNIANHSGLINADMPSLFLTFNGLIFVVTSLILFWGTRHGLFNE